MASVTTVKQLEKIVGRRPLGAKMKSLPHLDAHCERLLALSPLAILGWAETSGLARVTAVGGEPGFAVPSDPGTLQLGRPPGLDTLDGSIGVGLLFLIPGLGETLRVNGTARLDGGELRIAVEEAFIHCAKAVLRSSLWDPVGLTSGPAADRGAPGGRGPLAEPAVADWLERSPFLVVTSWDADGRADASPKGDPPGFARVDGADLLIPDRPGNRRTDTFHNLVEQPRVAVGVFVPGETRLLEVSGRAALTTDPERLRPMAVSGKIPKIAMRLAVDRAELGESRALAASELWDTSRHLGQDERPNMAAVFIDHVKQNRTRGAAATAVRALASKRILEAALAKDYEKNRY